MKIFVAILCFHASLTVSSAAYVCTNSTVTNTTSFPTDFIFLLDISPSMGSKIKGVISGLNAFAQRVSNANIDASFGVVTFAGKPTLNLPLTSNFQEFYQAMNGIGIIQNGQEASLEAIRLSLINQGSRLVKNCSSKYAISECILNYRSNANKVFILATDEDSDLPIFDRYPGQTVANSFCVCGSYQGSCLFNCGQFEPAFNSELLSFYSINRDWAFYNIRNESTLRLSDPYEAELKGTADLLVQNKVFLNLLIDREIGTGEGYYYGWPVSVFDYQKDVYYNLRYQQLKAKNSSLRADDNTVATYQFGNPDLQKQNPDFTGFNSTATLGNLQNAGLQNSLQARLLSTGNFARVFDIKNFVSNDGSTNSVISAFYSQLVTTTQYIAQQCVYVPDLTTSSKVSSKTSSKTTSTLSVKTSSISTSSAKGTSTSSAKSTTASSTITALTSTFLTTSYLTKTNVVSSKSSVVYSSSSSVPSPGVSVFTTSSASTTQSSSTTIDLVSSAIASVPMLSTSTIEITATTTTMETATPEITPDATTTVTDDSDYFYYHVEPNRNGPPRSFGDSSSTDTNQPPASENVAPESNKTVVAVTGASVGAAAIAAAAITVFLRRKRAAAMQNNAFNSANGSAISNPLYNSQTSISENPLFESSSNLAQA